MTPSLSAQPSQGAVELLMRPLVAFLAPGRISVAAVMPTLEWAQSVAASDKVVASPYKSYVEREVLTSLRRGSCPLLLVRGCQLYRSRPPEPWRGLLAEGRAAIVATSNALRESRATAARRNELLCAAAELVVFPYPPPEASSLRPLYERLLIERPQAVAVLSKG